MNTITGTLIECGSCHMVFATPNYINEQSLCPACGKEIEIREALNCITHNIVSYQMTQHSEVVAISRYSVMFRRQLDSSGKTNIWCKV